MFAVGTIPLSWAGPAAFPALQALQLQATQLTGSLPAALGTNGSMAALVFLEVDSSPVSGTLPEEWGSPSVFNQLGGLKLTNCNISGDPAVLEMVCCTCIAWSIDFFCSLHFQQVRPHCTCACISLLTCEQHGKLHVKRASTGILLALIVSLIHE